MKKNSKVSGYLISTGVGLITGLAIGHAVGAKTDLLKTGDGYNRLIPDRTVVEEGFMKPGELEINVKDFNNKGIPKVIGTYEGRNILWKLNEDGLPVAKEYKMKPAEIIEVKKQK